MSGFWGRAFHCRNYYDIQLKRLCDGAMGLAAVQFDASPPFVVYYGRTVNPTGLLRDHCEGRDKIDGDSRKRE